MGKEFKVIKEVATVSATLAELVAINRIICAEIPAAEFRAEYDSLLFDIVDTYRVVDQILTPLVAIDDIKVFCRDFPSLATWYTNNYQAALSKPRVNAEFTFEKYLYFRKRKETKTGYPALKAAFSRLHDLVDKWIDNDIWLAMSIDTILKMLYLHLLEVNESLGDDNEEAFNLYQSCVGRLPPYLKMIGDGLMALSETGISITSAVVPAATKVIGSSVV